MGLVERALAQPESDREAFVRRACGDDTGLFEAVWARVRSERLMKGFLLTPLFPRTEMPEPFAAGQLLGSRFRLTREVGHGGMGVVYEAMDERLGRRIAIKCARPGYQRRLPPEARNATEISHPNVCKTYEIHTADTPGGEADFLTMEYLEGETLSDRLGRQGRMELEEGRSLALQLSAGLEEAHRSGVIHGDLKSANVILVAREEAGTRAVITDFGLARRTTGPATSGIQGSLRGGTPAYMAPELWLGGKSSVGSDIFALGVILYEVFGGCRPFPDDSDVRLRLEHRPKRLGSLARRIPRHLDRTVLRCLDPNPLRRPASAAQVGAGVAGRGPNWRVAAVACLAALLAAVGDLGPPRPTRDPVRMAVLPFEARQEGKPLYEGLLLETSSLLRDIQAPRSGFAVIPVGESIARHVTTAKEARLLLGATHVLHGTLQENGGTMAIRAGVMDTVSLQDLKPPVSLEYVSADMSRMPVALAGIVTGWLGLDPVKVADPVGSSAYEDYTAGLAHLQHDSELDQSIAALERAVKADPRSALTHAALAEACRRKYAVSRESLWKERANESLKKAEALNPDLGSVRQTAGLIQLDAGQYARAVQDFGRAVELNPNDSDAYQRLARAYHWMNRDQEALAAHRKAIEVQPGYYRPYEQLGAFYLNAAHYEQAAEQFRKVVELIPGWPDSHFELAAAYVELGRYPEAAEEARLALALDRNYVNALITLGVALDRQGRDAEAIPYYERAAGLTPNSYLPWMNLADSYRRNRQPAQARRAYRKGLELARQEVLRNPQAGEDRACAAYLMARLGDRQEAEYEISQALALPAVDEQVRRMAALTYEALGRREQALSLLKDAPLAAIRDVGGSPDMADLRRDPRFLELLDERKLR